MSISLALQNSLSGLTASQAGLGVVSQNVANANTPGYSRQIAGLEAKVIAGRSSGVQISGIERVVNQFLVDELQAQRSVVGAANAVEQFLTEIQARFGTPANNTSLSADLAEFGVALDTLAVNPEDPALRFNVVASGQSVARSISEMASGIQNLRTEADKDIRNTVDLANAQLRNIHDLNAQISRGKAVGASTASLEDQRDRAISKLSESIAITTFDRGNGALTVLTKGGAALVDNEPRELAYTPASVVSAGTVFSDLSVFRLDLNTGQRTGLGDVLVTSGTSATVTDSLQSGRIKGLIDVRDQNLSDLAEQIELIATTIGAQYNAVHNDGVSFPAPNSLTGTRPVALGDSFTGTGSVRIAVLNGDGTLAANAVDLDLTALGTVTIGTLVSTIDTALGADGSAAVVNGRVVITATDSAEGIAIHNNTSQVTGTTQGFSEFLGMNDFFTGTDGASFAVRSDIVNDPSRVAVAQLSLTATATQTGIAAGDNRAIDQLSSLTQTSIAFASVAGLPAGNFTLSDYAGAILGLNAVQSAAAIDDGNLQRSMFANLDHRQASESGVNVDEEMANMVVFQNAFAASARVLTAASEMFDVLISIAG